MKTVRCHDNNKGLGMMDGTQGTTDYRRLYVRADGHHNAVRNFLSSPGVELGKGIFPGVKKNRNGTLGLMR